MKKRLTGIFALALTLVCVLSLLPVTVYAVSGDSGNLKWELNGSALEIKGNGTMPDYSEADMAPWYDMADSIKTVTIGKGVKTIGNLAFYGCGNLISVSLPAGITHIGDRAFKNCTSLTRIALPAGLEGIGEACFEECESLTAIFLPEGLKTIGDYAFFRCSALKSVTVPASVEKMGMVVFAYCAELAAATIRCDITRIPDWTFYGCEKLVSLTLPDTVKTAGSKSFHECGNLTNIYYNGASSAELMSSIQTDPTALASNASIRTKGQGENNREIQTGESTSETVSTVTGVVDGEHTTIIRETETSTSYKKDGQDIPWQEAQNEVNSGNTIETVSKTKDNLYTSISDSDGWTDLAKTAQGIYENNDGESQINANIQLDSSSLKGDDLGKLAGSNTVLDITTDNAARWRIDTAGMEEKDVAGQEYDLTYTVTRVSGKKKGIESDEIYKLKMEDGIGGNTKIAARLSGSRAGSYATLYEKKWFHYEAMETVLIDNYGDAWFDVSGITSGGTYYIGVNARDVDAGKATIPHTMLSSSYFDPQHTLTDADGNAYSVGDRESSWGITGKRFSLYVGLGMGAVVLIVAVVMFTINTTRRAKCKAAQEFGGTSPTEETEEEMRLRIMRDMLSKIKKKKPDDEGRKR